MNKKAKTPLMQQYWMIKEQYADSLVLFQVGDFYELFYEDAQKAAAFLAITLTTRGKDDGEPIPLCGVPLHAAHYYIAKLVKGGFTVALCNQLEEAVPGKMVRRGVVQVFTPGTLTDEKLLDEKQPCYLFSFFPLRDSWGLLFAELLTAQLFGTVLKAEDMRLLDAELGRFLPNEILIPETKEGISFHSYFQRHGYPVTKRAPYQEYELVQQWLTRQFNPSVMQSLQERKALMNACMHMYGYLHYTQMSNLDHFKHFQLYNSADFLILDMATQRNLELVKNAHDGSAKNTLLNVLDRAATAMGSRMIRKWILRPLIDLEAITARQDALEIMIKDVPGAQKVKKNLHAIGDIERVIGRICLARGTIADYRALKEALGVLPLLKQSLFTWQHSYLMQVLLKQMGDFADLYTLLNAALNDDSAHDWIIAKGFDERLDQMRALIDNAQQHIAALELQEQQKTGISSLKIRYAPLHGYYVEITKTHSASVPDYYQRMQSLVGKERYMIEPLKQLQADIIAANNHCLSLEKELFERIKKEVSGAAPILRKMAQSLSMLDALFGMAQCAYERGYVRPSFNQECRFVIHAGKHPVLEAVLENHFVANDTVLDESQSLIIITGPNMGGKSTYLRQTALIALMAQMGSFVPAAHAELSICDKIFTRIGASDNVVGGKSTFLVEMEETANICVQATEKSLIILDEVGRGTSTFDGLAIAQAVVEYIAHTIKSRCLFATHYHELTQLHSKYPMIVPYCAVSKKTDTGIIFLHKIVRGIAEGSFGIEVAKLAQMPHSIVVRAQEILENLQTGDGPLRPIAFDGDVDKQPDNMVVELTQQITSLKIQLQKKNELLQMLAHLDYEHLSPKKAFDIIWQAKDIVHDVS